MLPNAATSQRSERLRLQSEHIHGQYNNNKPLISLSEGQEEVKSFLSVSDWPGSKVNRLEVDSVRSRTDGDLVEREKNREEPEQRRTSRDNIG